MGRKTHDFMVRAGQPAFPGLVTCVLTRNTAPPEYKGVHWVTSDTISFVNELREQPGKDIWLMGGSDLACTFFSAAHGNCAAAGDRTSLARQGSSALCYVRAGDHLEADRATGLFQRRSEVRVRLPIGAAAASCNAVHRAPRSNLRNGFQSPCAAGTAQPVR